MESDVRDSDVRDTFIGLKIITDAEIILYFMTSSCDAPARPARMTPVRVKLCKIPT